MGATLTILRLGEANAVPLPAFLKPGGLRGLLLEFGPETPAQGLADLGLATATCPPERVLELCRLHDLERVDVLALHAPVDAALAEHWCAALRPRLVHAPRLPGLVEWLGNSGYDVSRQGEAWVAEAPAEGPDEAARQTLIDLARARSGALLEAGELAQAEPIIAALAVLRPGETALQKAALGCNIALGQPARARRFARAVLGLEPGDPVAHLAMLDAHVEGGDAEAEEASRLAIALAPPGILNPLRQVVEAHQVVSRWLSRPAACDAAPLVATARALPTEGDWAWHYRSLVEAADPALLAPTSALPGTRPDGDAQVVLLVAADAAYVRLYGDAYLRSVLARLDVPARVVLHVIGGGGPTTVGDPRVTVTRDDFDAAAITTRCHDSTGPRAIPVAHFQSIRFAQAEHWLARTGLPVIVSDIDVILQRGIADLLARHAGDDVVLNRNAGSQAFGSHLTANLAMFMPTIRGRAFAADLRGYLDRALARPDVSRWIDQCGLQMVWHAHACSGKTRLGWFDTDLDINNLIYPRWAPNPFRFLSLFHGFDMDSLPAIAA